MPNKINVYETMETRINNIILTDIKQQSVEMRSLVDFDWYIQHFNLRRGDIVTFVQTEITAEIVTYKEYRYGYSGQEKQYCKNRGQTDLSSETLKLWKTAQRGWYWMEAES